MDDSLVSAAAAMAAMERRLDVAAENLIHARQPGWQPRSTVSRSFASEIDAETGRLRSTPPREEETVSFEQGAIVPCPGRPTAVALTRSGVFFEVETPQGPAYTRNGDFEFDGQGRLVTRSGFPVRGAGGPIRKAPGAGEVAVDESGRVRQGETDIGRIRVTGFENLRRLRPISDTLFQADEGATARAADDVKISTHSLEHPEDQTVAGVVQMIALHRGFDAAQRVVLAISDSYDRLTRSQG